MNGSIRSLPLAVLYRFSAENLLLGKPSGETSFIGGWKSGEFAHSQILITKGLVKMLRVGVNCRKVNYNREEIFVYHLTDNITEKLIPICGADGYDFTDESEVDWLLKRIEEGRAIQSLIMRQAECVTVAEGFTWLPAKQKKNQIDVWLVGSGKKLVGS